MARRYTGGFVSSVEKKTDSNSANGIYTLQDSFALSSSGDFPVGEWTPKHSIRIRKNNTASFNRTPTTSTNRRTWTYSVWCKLGEMKSASNRSLFSAGNGTYHSRTELLISSQDGIYLISDHRSTGGNYYVFHTYTIAAFRDPAAWYHIVVAWDTTQSASSNRLKFYVNGQSVAYTTDATYGALPQNHDGYVNSTSSHYIGRTQHDSSPAWYDGYMAEINFIDGQALDPSYFGKIHPRTGTWVPKKYSGTYGTNGFYLQFNPDVDTSRLTTTQTFTADFFVLAGGGGGGTGYGSPAGGGGAGGFRTSAGTSGGNAPAEESIGLELNKAYGIIVGAGGTGGVSNTTLSTKGFDSVFANIVSKGGGGGQNPGLTDYFTVSSLGAGGSGATGSVTEYGNGTLGQGSNGGLSVIGSGGLASGVGYNMGGGGGAGANGSNATTAVAGAGGAGLATTITGSSVTYGGGGAGGNDSARVNGPASGGSGIGGNSVYGGAGTNAATQTGSGGGGGSNRANAGGSGYNGGNGSAGIIIIKIPNSRTATFSAGVTSSINTSVSGYKIYTVTNTSTTSETVTFT